MWIVCNMGNFSRPPCDEAAILAGACELPATKNGPWILAATILGSSMAFIDGTVVNVALPALQSALGATLAEVQWVVESYALFLAALLLIGGSLGDRYGRRRIFTIGVAALLGCLRMVRTRARHTPVDFRPRSPGRRRSAARARKPGSHQRKFLRAGTRARHRHMVRLHFHHCRHRSRPRWMVYGAWFVALGILHQSSNRFVRHAAGHLESSREQGRPTDRAIRLAGRRAGRGRFRRRRLWTDRIVRACSSDWRHHPDRTVLLGSACRRADGPAPPVPLGEFQRSQSAHPLSVFRA